MSSWGSANHDAITMQQRTKEPEEIFGLLF